MTRQIGRVNSKLRINATRYRHGNTLCVLLVTGGEAPPFPLSVNLHGHSDTDLGGLEEGEFVMSNNFLGGMLNKYVAQALTSGLVEDTGKRCSYGYVTDAPILRLVPPPMDNADPTACDVCGCSYCSCGDEEVTR